MRLVHKATGREVEVGNTVTDFRGNVGRVSGWVRPHKPDSEGHIIVDDTIPYYASVWGCEWIEREDRT